MKTTDFLNYNINRNIELNGIKYTLVKDSDGFFTINDGQEVVLVLNDDKFECEDKILSEKINSQIFEKKLMDITEKIYINQGKMIKFLIG